MPSNEIVRARIDPAIKKRAASALAEMGLTISDAIRLLMVRKSPMSAACPSRSRRRMRFHARRLPSLEAGKGARFETVADLMADLKREED